jgi:hypothetical protein
VVVVIYALLCGHWSSVVVRCHCSWGAISAVLEEAKVQNVKNHQQSLNNLKGPKNSQLYSELVHAAAVTTLHFDCEAASQPCLKVMKMMCVKEQLEKLHKVSVKRTERYLRR